ncbi:MAG: hypothetical protein L3J30_12290 [Marinosulfonomonas sp.]|nr:hypothetical protein [Marinosulfonomonas sp.]
MHLAPVIERLYNDAPNANKRVKGANIIGMLDFVVAISTGFSSSDGFARVMTHGQVNNINDYPTVLCPPLKLVVL